MKKGHLGVGEQARDIGVLREEKPYPPRRGDDDVRPLHQRLGLREHVHPSDDDGAFHLQGRAQSPELHGELVGQLAGGGDDQGEHAVPLLGEPLEDRESKSRRLAAARLGQAQHVVAGEDAGDAVALHGGGSLHLELLAGGDGPVGEAEVGEGRRLAGVDLRRRRRRENRRRRRQRRSVVPALFPGGSAIGEDREWPARRSW